MGGGSAVHQHLHGDLGADRAGMANEGVPSQSLGSRSPRIVASGWSVWLSPARRYVPLLRRKRSGLCSRLAGRPAGNGDVTALMDSYA